MPWRMPVPDEADHRTDLGEIEVRVGDEPADHRQPEGVVAEVLTQPCRDARVRELRGTSQGNDLPQRTAPSMEQCAGARRK